MEKKNSSFLAKVSIAGTKAIHHDVEFILIEIQFFYQFFLHLIKHIPESRIQAAILNTNIRKPIRLVKAKLNIAAMPDSSIIRIPK